MIKESISSFKLQDSESASNWNTEGIVVHTVSIVNSQSWTETQCGAEAECLPGPENLFEVKACG